MNTRCADLLREALDQPAAQRQEFLEQASAGDAALLADLMRLLELDADTDPFLDTPLDGVVAELLAEETDPADALDNLAPGDRIGPWQIISKLGSGGMGSVWLAERADGAYRQRVALKTIKPGMDSATVLAQFRRERNLLARLQHPNIAGL
ncbi:MAG: protein kinase, partial [Dokdonella sp.]|uniref:protein kinase n=1 Tax=Dokdonella sp. TaxID=2291710 RepID=UPI003BB1ED8A